MKHLLQSWASAPYFCQIIEAVLLCVLIAFSFLRPEFGSRWFERIEHDLRRLSDHRLVCLALIAACVVVVRLSLVTLLPAPKPYMHDEFSYLLAGKTYSSGRLANKPDAFWPHYETMHVLQQPTYISMYPPGQGLFFSSWNCHCKIAMGRSHYFSRCLTRSSVLGTSGWIPSHWALPMTLIAVVRWGLASYWINSYWGGAVPALGGALVFGSVPRSVKEVRVRHTISFASGIVLLANTRPYEGLAVIASSLVVLVLWTSRNGTLARLRRPLIWIPALAILASAAMAMLSYNRRVTNSPVILPYLLDRKQYAIVPLFLWQHTRPEPHYNSASLRKLYLAELDRYNAAREAMGFQRYLEN